MADFDPAAYAAGPQQASAPAPSSGDGSSFDPQAYVQEGQNERFGQPGEQIKAGLEGVAQGVLGSAAPYLENKVLKVPKANILAREKANPVIKGAGEVTGLVGSTLTGIPGLGTAMEGVGAAARGVTEAGQALNDVHAAQGALKLAQAAGDAEGISKAADALQTAKEGAKSVGYFSRVGSSAVQQAAEMAVLQGSDEASKLILNDPETSAQSAIANIGLAAALGGSGGAFITGAVSPLWNATAGKVLEGSLGTFLDHVNNVGPKLADKWQGMAEKLGVKVPQEIVGAQAGDSAMQYYNDLKRLENPAIRNAEETFHKDVSQSVLDATGLPAEDFQNHDIAAEGREGMEIFKKEAKAIHEPVVEEFNKLTEPFKNTEVDRGAHIAPLDEKISQLALDKGWVGAKIPQNELVEHTLQSLPKIKTAQDLKTLITEVGNIGQKDPQALGYAAGRIKASLLEGMQNILGDAIQKGGDPALFDRYVAARKNYAKVASLYDRMGQELSIGKFDGPETFLKRLEEKRSPEEFFKKLSPEGNAEILPILQENFPQTAEKVRQNEMKKIVAPAVRAAKGENAINVKTLNANITKKMAGQAAYAKWALPQQLIDRASAAEEIGGMIPKIKDSGTPGGLLNLIKSVPTTAIGTIAYITGHNPIIGALAGHLGQLLSRNAPEAIKLSLLRTLASGEPVSGPGFKAMVDMIHNVIKGESLLNKATESVFKSGSQVLTDKLMPNKADREKLDKIVEKSQQDPNFMMNLTKGETGHYLPQHQSYLTQNVNNQVQYLASLKPQRTPSGPLEKPYPLSSGAMDRYNRALDIANQPAVVLQHVKNGTLQSTDVQDLNALAPGVYNRMAQKLQVEMAKAKDSEYRIPYHTRMGVSLFLGSPIDPSMNPQSIMSAQPPPPPQPQPQGQPMKGRQGKGAINKMPNSYKTPSQAAESDRSSRD